MLVLCMMVTACVSINRSASGGVEEARGKASYYGDKFAGRTTANGETFDPDDMTAAHRTLPFDTKVRVTRTANSNRSVTVRINDRGPFVDGRIIDLSKAAAREIGMIDEGVVPVRVEVLNTPSGEEASSAPSGEEEAQSSGGW